MRRKLYEERLGLGDRVRAARKRRGLRQLDAAREIGVSRETVARIEVDHIPSARTRAKVLAWLAKQDAMVAAEKAAARKASAAGEQEEAGRVGGPGRPGLRAGRRLGAPGFRARARLALRRRAGRAIRS